MYVYIYIYTQRHDKEIKRKHENQAKKAELRLEESRNETVRTCDRLKITRIGQEPFKSS
jgi:hypothetical protein